MAARAIRGCRLAATARTHTHIHTRRAVREWARARVKSDGEGRRRTLQAGHVHDGQTQGLDGCAGPPRGVATARVRAGGGGIGGGAGGRHEVRQAP